MEFKWFILHYEYFYIWYLKYILAIILFLFDLSNILNAWLSLVTKYIL